VLKLTNSTIQWWWLSFSAGLPCLGKIAEVVGSRYFPCGFYEFSFSKWLELPSARSGTITTGLVLVLGGHKIRHCRISNEHGTETETDTCTINS